MGQPMPAFDFSLLCSISHLLLLFLQVNKQYTANDLEAFMKIAANWQNSNHGLLEGVDLKTGKLASHTWLTSRGILISKYIF